MLLKIYPDNPSRKAVEKVVQILKDGGVIIYPTDTVYAFGCDIYCSSAVERICRFKGLDPRKARLSFVCANLSQVSEYAKIDNATFKVLKSALPGPFTFILNGMNCLPKLFKARKEVGVRIPDNAIVKMILEELGRPLMSASVPKNEEGDYEIFPDVLEKQYGFLADVVIDGGEGGTEPSTVIDCTDGEMRVVRQGKGVFEY
ncbi:MAG: threonylcarbamoyl-AMP synthase [Paludibacteraceae bacterium]|jgi:tRNA threonylcarbamoyl adenosine modification protein (Sua5/YciO/YrdC/YwlC family)|nr:threonylcarbamoyl-AMP synthase [Paludibacteraceae bacterium]MDI9537304.1 L-threonylcarbamoyladenylate synthase [Bacteroidota bacterium]HHT61691.1 threonylcarbamoyl-AMP synthase [Bacteroidales bacterium]MBP9039878.1 threonylcarbamoyl-AMP synthase [Paludibacteraceae bacterium]HOO24621.1 L-threonylcarbamoyladenylate synthase [Paludibacteraceae bacterium]